MGRVFTRNIEGELVRFLWRDRLRVAFLSITPLAPDHALVVPKEEIEH